MSSSTSSPGNYQLKSTTLTHDGHLLYEFIDMQSYSHQCSIAVKLNLKLSSKLAAMNAMLYYFLGRTKEALVETFIRNRRKIKDFDLDIQLCPGFLRSAMACFIAQAQCLQSLVAIFPNDLSASGLESAYNILVSAVVLSIVYQYLVGYVDRGGTKTYNPGSLEFRATYVSLLLFQGAYVLIKFRVVAKRTVSIRHKVRSVV